MTLQDFKKEVAKEIYGRDIDLKDCHEEHIEQITDEAAKRYARECVKASLEKAAEGFTRVAHDKITNESNIVLL